MCSSLTFSLKYKFSRCFSCCLDPTVAVVRPLNWTALVISLFLFQGLSFSLVLVGRYSAHASPSHAQHCPDRKLERPIFPWGSSISLFLFQESFSLVLVRRYGAHATASHAQDCPHWEPETCICVTICFIVCVCSREYPPLSLWLWLGVIVLMLRHRMHKTAPTGGWRKPFIP